jgi:thiol-disulfide isomerase/thioredoxin
MKFLLEKIPTGLFNLKFLTILLAVGTLLGTIIYVYYKYISPKLSPTYVANNEFVNPSDVPYAELTMFYTDWCPYCKKAMPVWDEMEQEYNGKIINGHELVVKKVDCSDDKNEQVKMVQDKFQIDGYPSIKLIKQNETVDFDAKPDKVNLEEFLDKVLM